MCMKRDIKTPENIDEKMVGLTISDFEKELNSLRKEAKSNSVFRDLGRASGMILDRLLEDDASARVC